MPGKHAVWDSGIVPLRTQQDVSRSAAPALGLPLVPRVGQGAGAGPAEAATRSKGQEVDEGLSPQDHFRRDGPLRGQTVRGFDNHVLALQSRLNGSPTQMRKHVLHAMAVVR